MLVKILGTIDLISGLILIFNLISILPKTALIFLGGIYLTKTSLGMLQDFASWIDFSVGIFFLISIFFQIPFLGIIVGIFLFQKAVFSFL